MSVHYHGQTSGSSFAPAGTGGFIANVPVPAGAVPGDLLVVAVSIPFTYDSGSATWFGVGPITTPPGGAWSTVAYDAEQDATFGSGTRVIVSYKFLDVLDPSSFAFTINLNNYYSWCAVALGGVDASTPIPASSSTPAAASTSLAAATITPGVANTELVAIWAQYDGGLGATASAYPAGFAPVTNPANLVQVALGFQAGTGATGAKTLTLTSPAPSVSVLLSVAPDLTPVSVTASDAVTNTRSGVGEFFTETATTALQAMIERRDGDVRFLVTLSPNGDTTLRYSTKAFITEPGDSPASTPFTERARVAINASRSLFSGRQIGGPASQSAGTVELVNRDGALNALNAMRWGLRDAFVQLLGPGVPYAEAYTVLRGQSVGVAVNREGVVVSLRDRSAKLDVDLQQNTYAGTGGLEGGADVKGKKKPVAVGAPQNVPLVKLDALSNTWQWSDPALWGTASVDAAFDAGGEMNTARYTVDLANNTITFLTNLFGTPTVNVTMDTGTTAAECVRALATIRALTYPNDFSQDAFLAYQVAAPGRAGWHWPIDAKSSVRDALTKIVLPGGAFFMGRSGRLWMGQFRDALGVPLLSIRNSDVLTIERQASAPPVWKYPLGYGQNFTVLTGTQVIGSAIGTDRETFLANQFRTTGDVSDSTILDDNPDATVPETIPSAIIDEAAAVEEAQRLLPIYGEPWDVVKVKVGAVGYLVDLVDLVALTHPRYGYDAELFRVIAIEEVGSRVTLTLWRTTPPSVLGLASGPLDALGLASGGVLKLQ